MYCHEACQETAIRLGLVLPPDIALRHLVPNTASACPWGSRPYREIPVPFRICPTLVGAQPVPFQVPGTLERALGYGGDLRFVQFGYSPEDSAVWIL
jgi:hypothetical protein